MGFSLTSREFAEYLKRTAAKIAENKDYITELDNNHDAIAEVIEKFIL